MRLGRSVNAVARTTGLGRQRQAGRHLLPLRARPAGLGTWGVSSARAILTGQAAPTNTARHRPSLDSERLKRARLCVERAIKEKKIFTVQGPYPIIRSLLRARGWVEKQLPREGRVGSRPEQHHGSQEKQLEEEEEERGNGVEQGEVVLDPQPSLGTSKPLCSLWLPEEEMEEQEEEQQDEDPDGFHDLMSHLVRDQVPYFIWTNRCSAFHCQLLHRDQVMNHYARVAAFTTKNGLCLSLQNLPLIDQADPDTFFPRCYRLGDVDDQKAFIEDFHLTAARSLLQVALERAEDVLVGMEQPQKPDEGAARPGSPLHSQLLEEALQICEQHLGSLVHQDIDRDPPLPHMTGSNWDCFLQDYYRVVHKEAKLMVTGAQRERCQALLQRLAEQLSQMGMEGNHNIWILKPGAKSRGRGIVCTARLEEVLQLVGCSGTPWVQLGEWVVQKYVERPLLIFGTKFDLRQWFLVTDWNPLTVWFYRESYVRFCSWPFSLCHLDPARHLCNVSIQKQYKPARGWHPQLPPDRIWSSRQLQAYLAQIGRADAWQQVMVPGMKAAVLAALRSAQDLVEARKGSFELYGADFIFGEDCQPWLLEINASPTMAPSSVVTRRLCASVQQDTLRVVIDHRNDSNCSTGAFELIYKEVAVPTPLYRGLKLMVKGCSLTKPHPAQHHSGDKPPITASAGPQRPTYPKPGSRATQVPQPEVLQEDLAVVGQRSHHCRTSSAPPAQLQPPHYCARSQRLLQLSHPHGQPQPTLPQLNVSHPPRMPVPPPRGAPNRPGGPKGCPPSSHPSRVLHLPELAPRAGTLRPCLLQLSPTARRQIVAPRKLQKNRDLGGHPGGHSTLPVLPEATQQHPAPLDPRRAPELRGGTQPAPLRSCKSRF
ncbi:tubulin monoglycylase TTLL3 isoform X2 [Cuculus canorus]|uniref:tubulin monoglycylase TTLL3 isoform X2 n=1 Tax=Cuculus canorus TaxID=55661 RepID=UPI0023AAA92A|nr:tubulin monoglycylase TTLL3 isoform X2 [Cuculus canorus]